MAKKTSVMDEVVEGVKSAAETMGQMAEQAVGIEAEKKVYERIVSITEVKVHTHLPAGTFGMDSASSAAGNSPRVRGTVK
jgi:hypothetical protein